MTKQQLISFERSVARLCESGKIKVPVHFCGGNEDELIHIFKKIRKQDYVFSTHRNHYHFLLKGGKPARLLSELLGRSNGICHGKSGSMHTIDHRAHFYSSGIVAGCVAIAAGVGWAIKRDGRDAHVYCFVGDGATDEGWFTEAMRYVIGHELPVTFIVEDNNRSVCTDKKTRWGKCQWEWDHVQVIHYHYTPKHPHVGTGRNIEW